jgi:hypothetical protein
MARLLRLRSCRWLGPSHRFEVWGSARLGVNKIVVRLVSIFLFHSNENKIVAAHWRSDLGEDVDSALVNRALTQLSSNLDPRMQQDLAYQDGGEPGVVICVEEFSDCSMALPA